MGNKEGCLFSLGLYYADLNLLRLYTTLVRKCELGERRKIAGMFALCKCLVEPVVLVSMI